MTTYTNNISDNVETIIPITDTRTYKFTDQKLINKVSRFISFKNLNVPCVKKQIPTEYCIFGTVQECDKIIFVNYKNELDATIIPDINGDFFFYAPNRSNPYDIIFITNNPIKGNKVYRSVTPVSAIKPNIQLHVGEINYCDDLFVTPGFTIT